MKPVLTFLLIIFSLCAAAQSRDTAATVLDQQGRPVRMPVKRPAEIRDVVVQPARPVLAITSTPSVFRVTVDRKPLPIHDTTQLKAYLAKNKSRLTNGTIVLQVEKTDHTRLEQLTGILGRLGIYKFNIVIEQSRFQ